MLTWMTPPDAHAVIETIYPSLAADWASNKRGALRVEPLETVSRRQRGMFKDIHRLPPAIINRTVAKVCGKCVRQPLWWRGFDARERDLACPSACNMWLSTARQLEAGVT